MIAIATRAQRLELVGKLVFSNDSQKQDLLNDKLTQPNLILALLHAVHKGEKILVTSVRSDHGDDSELGPHGHARGYSADIAPVGDDWQALTQGLCTDNPWVARVGRGGCDRDCAIDPGNTIVFNDNASDHIHMQTGG